MASRLTRCPDWICRHCLVCNRFLPDPPNGTRGMRCTWPQCHLCDVCVSCEIGGVGACSDCELFTMCYNLD